MALYPAKVVSLAEPHPPTPALEILELATVRGTNFCHSEVHCNSRRSAITTSTVWGRWREAGRLMGRKRVIGWEARKRGKEW